MDRGDLRKKANRRSWEKKTSVRENWHPQERSLIRMLKTNGITEEFRWHHRFRERLGVDAQGKDILGPAYIEPSLWFPKQDVVIQLTYSKDMGKGEQRMAQLRMFDSLLRDEHGQTVIRISTSDIDSAETLSLIKAALCPEKKEKSKKKTKRKSARHDENRELRSMLGVDSLDGIPEDQLSVWRELLDD